MWVGFLQNQSMKLIGATDIKRFLTVTGNNNVL